MKTIGFIDYYLSEWHANEYPAWIKQACEKLGKDVELKYAWAELDVSPVDGVTTKEWCDKYNVTQCKTIAELCEKADYILILSPSNPEKHLGYAKIALTYKKNTYIDKTFAPDLSTAKQIFDIAKENGTKFFSSSALRYANELDDIKDVSNVTVYGGGATIEEYIIHQTEMMVKLLQDKATLIRVEKQGKQYFTTVKTENGKQATMIFMSQLNFAVFGECKNGNPFFKVMRSAFFNNLIEDIINFFTTGEKSFDERETLEIMKVIDGVMRGKENLGEWIEI